MTVAAQESPRAERRHDLPRRLREQLRVPERICGDTRLLRSRDEGIEARRARPDRRLEILALCAPDERRPEHLCERVAARTVLGEQVSEDVQALMSVVAGCRPVRQRNRE